MNTAAPPIHTTRAQKRWHILVTGQVQGVGFRPFIYKLAHDRGLTGTVSNTSEGVHIEIQGNISLLEKFIYALEHSAPPLAVLTSCTVTEMSPLPQENVFLIKASPQQEASGHKVLISPDTSLCADCEADMQDSANRRHMYPFTNCTNCGPRYTITHSIPYDRKTTSMACFALCADCQAEYDNPLNRRFHAQPNACPVCGPQLCYVEKGHGINGVQDFQNFHDALRQCAQAIMRGKIVAIKGLGGFHLACSVINFGSIATLRQRKNRPHKPFAVMVKDLATAKLLAKISPLEEEWLTSREKPIVLCTSNSLRLFASNISPDTDKIGIMLPYTPLHSALFTFLEKFSTNAHPLAACALVMTSGNAGGEPICLGNREALERLAPLADAFLLHNRDILVRTDDSVCTMQDLSNADSSPQEAVYLRRARGFVPRPICIPSWTENAPSVLGMGAELKSCLCLTRGQNAFLSQHIGDLQNVATLQFYTEVLEHLQMLLQTQPSLVVHDLHPDFLSTQVAKDLAKSLGIPCISLQHHYAHAYAVLAEHNHSAPCLALSLDGTGLGDDGTIWGGELLYVEGMQHQRLGRLSPFPLVGGEKAIQEPWRIALALAHGTAFEEELCAAFPQAPMLLEMLQKNIHCPLTSSVGRLFDAVAAALGLCRSVSYEGQAAIKLEHLQRYMFIDAMSSASYPASKNGELWEVSSKDLFLHALNFAKKINPRVGANIFHSALCASFVDMAQKARQETGIRHIALSGGVLQNATVYTLLYQGLSTQGFTVLTHKHVPSNDGGLCLGQAYYGMLQL